MVRLESRDYSESLSGSEWMEETEELVRRRGTRLIACRAPRGAASMRF